jgi:hypothetical protein
LVIETFVILFILSPFIYIGWLFVYGLSGMAKQIIFSPEINETIVLHNNQIEDYIETPDGEVRID